MTKLTVSATAFLLTAMVAWSSAVVAEQNDEEEDGNTEWTHTPILKRNIAQWNEEGKPDIPTSALPQEVVDAYDLGFTIPPEVFFSTQIQDMLSRLLDPPDDTQQSTSTNDSQQRASSGYTFSELKILNANSDLNEFITQYARFIGLDDVEDLSPDTVEELTNAHSYFSQIHSAIDRQNTRFAESSVIGTHMSVQSSQRRQYTLRSCH